MKKIFLLNALLILVFATSNAQQDPHYTQYMYNMNVVNPAYAGSKEQLSGALLYRQQWAGLEGAPKTASLALHSPVGKNVGLGFSAISDKIGPVEESNVYADFSYKLNLGDDRKLYFGLKAGATFKKVEKHIKTPTKNIILLFIIEIFVCNLSFLEMKRRSYKIPNHIHFILKKSW